jgi:Patatin-like phospholipase
MRVARAMYAVMAPVCAAATIAGCQAFSHSNQALDETYPAGTRAGGKTVRATFKVDAQRGNPRVLFFLALSGGGSRAAYFSAATMLKLQTVFDDIDLLGEVDAISSVSGGSLPAAYYALSRDASLPLPATLAALLTPAVAKSVSAKLAVEGRTLRCTSALAPGERARLAALLGPGSAAESRVAGLCAQAPLVRLRPWNDAVVRDLMKRNYVLRWIGNWFWPDNIFLYWFTAYDRSDIMAKTLEDNLYDTPVLGAPLRFRDLNPWRPYLILNATDATEQADRDAVLPETFAFGSVFTYTDDDFQARLHSDIEDYSVARAVMSSSAFPLVFPNMTLGDYRPQFLDACRKPGGPPADDRLCRPLYLHLFDGGNSDNLGLRSIKRALFEMVLDGRLTPGRDKVIVLLVDAFTKPVGAKRTDFDPRGLAGLIVDFNVVDAIDSLLQANRAKIAGEFKSARLRWREGDCSADSQNLPPALCAGLEGQYGRDGLLDLSRSLVFYHFGFDDIGNKDLKARLDRISTSFQISDENAGYLDDAVNLVLTPQNRCLGEIRSILRDEAADVRRARAVCGEVDTLPPAPPGS